MRTNKSENLCGNCPNRFECPLFSTKKYSCPVALALGLSQTAKTKSGVPIIIPEQNGTWRQMLKGLITQN